jgi:single-strand selective monofunctional uracil DNA glycosylase
VLPAIYRELSHTLDTLQFGPPTTHVYNPLQYAAEPFAAYCRRYGRGRKEVVLVGMNPGPFGMVQTGIPFGAITAVRDWMMLKGQVGVPQHAHPKRPVTGFACTRTEVSGRRLWDWAAQRFGSAEQFFARFFVANYCPLAFMEESGKNRTPDALPPGERAPLFAACDSALRKVVQQLRPSWVVGIGAFAEGRCLAALQGLPVQVGRVLHPSPQSPQANRGWSTAAEAQLRALGIAL